MTLKGGITHVSFDEIYGWARLSTDPYRPLSIQAMVGDRVVAEARADLVNEDFLPLGDAVAACGFMLDISEVRLTKLDALHILADGFEGPWGQVHVPPRPADAEVYIDESRVAHVFAYRLGTFVVESDTPLEAVRIYSRSRRFRSDRRRLGALIGSVAIDGKPLDMASPAFVAGFHDVEQGDTDIVRWTDGSSTLDFSGSERPSGLSFRVYTLAENTGG